ncbi:cyclodeaminase/cyclohydrolase family protein [Clostridium sp. SHJSY1]|uniref:cyclodeaminase/cyclohydrolase family protein n=1 Tax=Clostridium sp. SHJSY1 TaxID=2942483 RepID=UPI0028768550|nr:cyclodeaminase/cyclohydrolase family protein [Clostridium sp. SHJSY1]MDS0527288.1 cyclodeaminase/cyclohydrolase family protein [Clostridium sp. SHJSY1]
MNFKEYKVEEFIEDLSSSSPSPGGGSVAGLVSALAGSLNSMVYSLTVNKKSFEALDIDIKKAVLDFCEASKKFTKRSIMLMEEDRKYFNELMDCYKLKKDSDEEKEKRNKAILEGTLKAMKAPLELAREGYKFYNNIDIAVRYGNKMLISDAGCAAILLHAAIESSIINVKVNLNSLREKSFSKGMEEEIASLEINSLKRKELICKEVNKIIYPEI